MDGEHLLAAFVDVIVEAVVVLHEPQDIARGAIGEVAQQHALGGQRLARANAALNRDDADVDVRSEEHTSELQSLMRISYAVFCLKKKKIHIQYIIYTYNIQNRKQNRNDNDKNHIII